MLVSNCSRPRLCKLIEGFLETLFDFLWHQLLSLDYLQNTLKTYKTYTGLQVKFKNVILPETCCHKVFATDNSSGVCFVLICPLDDHQNNSF